MIEQDAQETIALIRGTVAELAGRSAADELRIQYGGSVKASNAEELAGKPDIDGALVGGASLTAAQFGALLEGLDWRRVHGGRRPIAPQIAG